MSTAYIELRYSPDSPRAHKYFPVPPDIPQYAGTWEIEKHPYHSSRELIVWHPEGAKRYDPLEAAALVLQKLSAASREDKNLNLKAVFKKYDTDGGGSIDREEFANVLEEFKILLTPGEINAVFKIFDPDGGGTISYIEFVYSVFNRRKFIKSVKKARANNLLSKDQVKKTPGYLSHTIAYDFIKKQEEERRQLKAKSLSHKNVPKPSEHDGDLQVSSKSSKRPKKPEKSHSLVQVSKSPRIIEEKRGERSKPKNQTRSKIVSTIAQISTSEMPKVALPCFQERGTKIKIVETKDLNVIASVESTLAINQWLSINFGRIKDLFVKMDVDGSGTCSIKEFLRLLKEMKSTKKKRVKAVHDVRHEQTVQLASKWKSKSDHANSRKPKNEKAQSIDFDLVERAFNMIDTDNSGEISLRELERYVRKARSMEGMLKQKARDIKSNIMAKEAMRIKINVFGGLTPRRPRLSPRRKADRPQRISQLSTVKVNSVKQASEIKIEKVGANKEKTESEVLAVLESWMNLHIIRIKDIFFQMDIDKSGALSVQEFIQLFSKIGDGIQPRQMETLFANLDEDQSGDVTLDELQRYLRKRRKQIAAEGIDRSAARIKLRGGVEFETHIFMD